MTEAGRSEAAAEGRGADPALPPPAPGSGGSLNFFVFILRVAFYFSSLFFSFFPPLFFFFFQPPSHGPFSFFLPSRPGRATPSAALPASRRRGAAAGAPGAAHGAQPPPLRPLRAAPGQREGGPQGCGPAIAPLLRAVFRLPKGTLRRIPQPEEGREVQRGGGEKIELIIIIKKIDKPHDAGARPGGLPVSEEPPLDSRKAEPGVGAVREPRRSSPPPAARQPRRPEPFLASRRLME